MEGESSHLFWGGMKHSLEEPIIKKHFKERVLPWLNHLILRWLKMARVIPCLNLLRTLPLKWEELSLLLSYSFTC